MKVLFKFFNWELVGFITVWESWLVAFCEPLSVPTHSFLCPCFFMRRDVLIVVGCCFLELLTTFFPLSLAVSDLMIVCHAVELSGLYLVYNSFGSKFDGSTMWWFEVSLTGSEVKMSSFNSDSECLSPRGSAETLRRRSLPGGKRPWSIITWMNWGDPLPWSCPIMLISPALRYCSRSETESLCCISCFWQALGCSNDKEWVPHLLLTLGKSSAPPPSIFYPCYLVSFQYYYMNISSILLVP